MRLKNKKAIVTGGASGFGAEIARVFAREGASVLIVDQNQAGAEAVAAEIGGLALYCLAAPLAPDLGGPQLFRGVDS